MTFCRQAPKSAATPAIAGPARSDRRCGGLRLHGAGSASFGMHGRDSRGRRHAHAFWCGASTRVPCQRRGAMRHLYAGHADGGGGAFGNQPGGNRSRGGIRARRRAVPLHRLPENHCGCLGSRRRSRERTGRSCFRKRRWSADQPARWSAKGRWHRSIRCRRDSPGRTLYTRDPLASSPRRVHTWRSGRLFDSAPRHRPCSDRR